MVEVRIDEQAWSGDEEAVVTQWYFEAGERVAAGDIIAEVMIEKIQMTIEAPAAGLLQPLKKLEEPIRKGDAVATIS